MNRNVSIAVTGSQTDEGNRETVSELKVQGQYFEKNGCRYLLYEESDPETGAVSKNTLKARDNLLELSRKGSLSCTMIFEAGKRHRTDYRTPYGLLTFEVLTEEVRCLWSEDEAGIEIKYRLEADSRLLSRNELQIRIKNLPNF